MEIMAQYHKQHSIYLNSLEHWCAPTWWKNIRTDQVTSASRYEWAIGTGCKAKRQYSSQVSRYCHLASQSRIRKPLNCVRVWYIIDVMPQTLWPHESVKQCRLTVKFEEKEAASNPFWYYNIPQMYKKDCAIAHWYCCKSAANITNNLSSAPRTVYFYTSITYFHRPISIIHCNIEGNPDVSPYFFSFVFLRWPSNNNLTARAVFALGVHWAKRDVDRLLVWCWASVCDAGPTSTQQWVKFLWISSLHGVRSRGRFHPNWRNLRSQYLSMYKCFLPSCRPPQEAVLLYKAKRRYLLTCKVTRYCLFVLL